MTEHFLIWILQQDVDGIIHDVKESDELAKTTRIGKRIIHAFFLKCSPFQKRGCFNYTYL